MTELDAGASTVLSDVAELGGEGAGQVLTPPEPVEPEKPLSLRDTVEQVVKEADAPKEEKQPEKEEKPEKAEPEAKEEPEEKKATKRDETGKFAKAEQEVKEPQVEKRSADPRDDAPTRFQADAKERWANVPNPVKRDIQVMLRDHETEITRHKEASERYEPLRQYDELARQNGRSGLQETLNEVVRLEQQMKANPLVALNEMLMRAGPRKADGQPISLYELANAVVNMGQQEYHGAINQSQQQTQQEDPRVEQLQTELQRVKEEQINNGVIEPFRSAHPRYDELQEDIAFFLKTGKVNPSLSMQERLEVAYDMAVRINPTSQSAPQDPTPHSTNDRVAEASAAKSIKSAPGAVTPDMEPERGGSIMEILEDEMRRQGIRR